MAPIEEDAVTRVEPTNAKRAGVVNAVGAGLEFRKKKRAAVERPSVPKMLRSR
jgi:hypothetical protein